MLERAGDGAHQHERQPDAQTKHHQRADQCHDAGVGSGLQRALNGRVALALLHADIFVNGIEVVVDQSLVVLFHKCPQRRRITRSSQLFEGFGHRFAAKFGTGRRHTGQGNPCRPG